MCRTMTWPPIPHSNAKSLPIQHANYISLMQVLGILYHDDKNCNYGVFTNDRGREIHTPPFIFNKIRSISSTQMSIVVWNLRLKLSSESLFNLGWFYKIFSLFNHLPIHGCRGHIWWRVSCSNDIECAAECHSF